MVEITVIIALLVFIGFREWSTQKERQQMLDRLMSRDIQEYRQPMDKDEPNVLESQAEDDNIISLSVDNPDDIPEEIRKEIENA